jgi:prepilin-type N-terminal cleavage/methylation domain-containing protein
MKATSVSRHRSQAGYTLIELMVASALGVIVMSALTSVVLTTMVATNTANSRIEASRQIRNFELTAYDDFVHSTPVIPPGCGTASNNRCTVEPLVLDGLVQPNQLNNAPAQKTVTYAWDGSRHVVTRTVGTSRNVSTNVTAFDWYVEGNGAHSTVVVDLTIKIDFYNVSHVESQTLRFFPRVTQ